MHLPYVRSNGNAPAKRASFSAVTAMAPVPTGHNVLRVVRRIGRDVPGAERERTR